MDQKAQIYQENEVTQEVYWREVAKVQVKDS